MSTTPSDLIRVHCPCGARMKVRSTSLGRKAKCPTCQEVFLIAKDKATQDDTFDLAPVDTTSSQDSLLAELARQEKQQVAVSQPASPSSSSSECPQCGTRMPGHAVMCVSCGFNTQTGKSVKGTSAKKSAVADKVRKLAAGAGTYLLGCVFSGVGALVGAGIWFAIAVIANVEIGWIAWGLGILAGAGMRMGYHSENFRAGVTAAGFSLFGIFAAKIAVFAFVVVAVTTGDTDNVDFQSAYLKNTLTEQTLDEQKIWSDEDREAHWEETYNKIERKVDRMSVNQIAEQCEELRLQREKAELDDDGLGDKREQVASHKANLRSIQNGYNYGDFRRKRIFEEEFDKCTRYNEEQLDDHLAQIEQWEKEGKWSDKEYVRDQLVFKIIEEEFESDPANKEQSVWDLSRSQWSTLHKSMLATVDAMEPEIRLQRLQVFEKTEKDEYNRNRLIYHELNLKTKSEGLSYGDPKRDQILEDCKAEFASLNGEALGTRIHLLDQWEESGKDSDYDYLRNHLIYMHINQMMVERRIQNQSDANSKEYWEPSGQEWDELYSQAKDIVEPLSDIELASEIELVEQQRNQRWQEKIDEADREAMKEATGEVASLFFSAMFSPFDALFIFLAVGSAFKIATGGGVDD